ncbi:MAG: hypothetical protein AAB870_04220, partial [Patescibacteria group bacterium]
MSIENTNTAKIAVVAACGGGIGAFLGITFGPTWCWVGMLIGALVAYLGWNLTEVWETGGSILQHATDDAAIQECADFIELVAWSILSSLSFFGNVVFLCVISDKFAILNRSNTYFFGSFFVFVLLIIAIMNAWVAGAEKTMSKKVRERLLNTVFQLSPIMIFGKWLPVVLFRYLPKVLYIVCLRIPSTV